MIAGKPSVTMGYGVSVGHKEPKVRSTAPKEPR